MFFGGETTPLRSRAPWLPPPLRHHGTAATTPPPPSATAAAAAALDLRVVKWLWGGGVEEGRGHGWKKKARREGLVGGREQRGKWGKDRMDREQKYVYSSVGCSCVFVGVSSRPIDMLNTSISHPTLRGSTQHRKHLRQKPQHPSPPPRPPPRTPPSPPPPQHSALPPLRSAAVCCAEQVATN